MIVRWIGAFRKKNRVGLRECLNWEITQNERSVLAAERLVKRRSFIHHARVGLVVANKAIIRKYSSDVWSEYDGRRLKPTRPEGEAWSEHQECFVRPIYRAIIIKGRGRISRQAWSACRHISDQYGLPILRLTRDRRIVTVNKHRAESQRDRPDWLRSSAET